MIGNSKNCSLNATNNAASFSGIIGASMAVKNYFGKFTAPKNPHNLPQTRGAKFNAIV